MTVELGSCDSHFRGERDGGWGVERTILVGVQGEQTDEADIDD